MELIRIIQSLSTALTALTQFVATAGGMANQAIPLLQSLAPSASYKNVSLLLELDICDAEGEVAILRRTQMVEFRTPDAGIVRELLWGEGRRGRPRGSRGTVSLGTRREGGKEVGLLSTQHPPAKGERRRIETKRVIRGALLAADEYFEAQTERPTGLLKLRVLFPTERRLVAGRAEMSPPRAKMRALRPALTRDGRTSLSWTIRNPRELATYRLAWHW